MPKMPSIRAREVVRIAQAVGFIFDRQRGSHAIYYRSADRRRVVIPMHGTKDLKPGTLRGIIDDLGLSVEAFIETLNPEPPVTRLVGSRRRHPSHIICPCAVAT